MKDVNFETPFSEIYEATPMEFPLDQGILVIDETKDGNGSAGNPDDVMVDDFYQSVINSQFTSYDYADEGIPGLEFLANFSTIIWHDDDLNQHYIEDNINDLGCYLAGGGNLLISGWKTANEIPNYFINDFINCNQTQLIAGFEFTGASSTEYPDINIDPDQLSPAFNGKLPYSCIFPEATNGIYYFEGITGSPYIGEVCALKNESEGTVILMGFPLYYMHNEEVEDFFDQFLIEIGEVGTDDLVVNPNKFYSIAYPNPFNPTTTISFNLTAENAENAELEIYNLKGQKVKTLVNEKLNAGQHSVSWSGNDENGRSVSSGIYFYKLKAGDFEQTKKMMLLK